MTIDLIIKSLDLQFDRMDQLEERMKILPINREVFGIEESRTVIDAFIYRFSKIQDMMGQKLFPAFLEFVEEDPRRLTFIDMINLLEKLEVIPAASQWLSYRNLRNDLSHEYPDNEEEIVEGIGRAMEAYPQIKQIYKSIKEEYNKR